MVRLLVLILCAVHCSSYSGWSEDLQIIHRHEMISFQHHKHLTPIYGEEIVTLKDLCEQVEFSFWRTAEYHCKLIQNRTALDMWHFPYFSFFRNVRTQHLLLDSIPRLLVAFDILGPISSFGNWWRVIIHGEGDLGSFQVAARIVDHWNGNYTVYFQLPSPGHYKIDILLEYIACQGYPFVFSSDSKSFLYRGNFTSAEIVWKPSDTSPDLTTDEIFRYLADTGYYINDIWVPANMTYACVSQSSIAAAPVLTFSGDSTTAQLYACFKSSHCLNTLQQRMMNQISEAQLQQWIQANASEHRIFYYSNTKPHHVFRYLQRILSSQIIVANSGLHLTADMPWVRQKKVIDEIAATVKNRNDVMAVHINNSTSNMQVIRRKYFVWRDTWSIHEYCFVPNAYWSSQINDTETLGNETHFNDRLVRLRDASVHIQRSYALDKIVRSTGKAYWLPTHFASKAAFKMKDDRDMRHHDMRVISAVFKSLWDMIDIQ